MQLSVFHVALTQTTLTQTQTTPTLTTSLSELESSESELFERSEPNSPYQLSSKLYI